MKLKLTEVFAQQFLLSAGVNGSYVDAQSLYLVELTKNDVPVGFKLLLESKLYYPRTSWQHTVGSTLSLRGLLKATVPSGARGLRFSSAQRPMEILFQVASKHRISLLPCELLSAV